ncbi:GNAT family protein [Aeromicrobium panaciterrae]|uniref:GNAT family N-acetyltransferase n=1 Tax=Aeromicrobium panaciterrae TaxID=363861 RepID=UPI0031E2BABE
MSEWFETPGLAGDLVRLEPLEPRHAPGLLAASDDDEVFTWQLFHRPTTLPEAEALVELYLGRPHTCAWVQVDQRSNQVAGLTTYYDIDASRRTVAIGATWLGRRFWRTGVNTEAKLLLLRRAFDQLGCARVVWHVDIKNERSQAAVTRIGGVREGVLRKHIIRRDGSWRDTVLFSMIDDEWPAARDQLEQRLRREGAS